MTFHVTCPFSGKRFNRDTITDLRRFVYAMMTTRDCDKRIRLYDGKQYYGSMWKAHGYVWYQTKGSRTKRLVNSDGTLRM
jgi:hypothetical protein